MPAIAAMTIVDGKSTPVSHVFQPITSSPEALYKRTGVAGQSAAAMESVVLKLSPAKKVDGVNIIPIELAIPVMEQPAGGTPSGYMAPPAVAHTLRFKGNFYLHNRSLTEDRKDLRVMVSNLLKDAQVIDLIDNLTPPN